MVKLIHGADFHLDSPFAGLTPEQAARRRGEQRELLERLGQLARDRGAKLVLLAGDLLDGRQTYRETAQALAQSLGSIPCPVLIAPGNHDYFSIKSLYAALEWPDNVHIFTAGALTPVEFPDLGCTVWGAAFSAARREDAPLAGFRAQARPGWTKLAVLHGEVDGGQYGPISRREIGESGLDYLALGHIHRYSGLQREGETCWAYPGCPEGRGFDETGDKGVLYVEAEPGACQEEFIPLCRRRYRILQADVTGAEDLLPVLRRALPEAVGEDVCRLVLTGERDGPVDLERLSARLADRCFALTLRDRTRVGRDLWARMEEDSLTGLFLRAMAARLRGEPDSQTLRLAVRFGLAALENGEDAAP